MKTYTAEAEAIWENLKAFKEQCTQLAYRDQFYTPDEMRKACQRTWPDFSIEFLPPDKGSDLDFDNDCIFGGPNLFEQVRKVSAITFDEPLTDEQVLRYIASKWVFFQSIALARGGSPCVMVPRFRGNDKINNLTFSALNARVRYTKPTDMTLGQFLNTPDLRDQLLNLGEALLKAAHLNHGHATEESFLQATKKEMLDYAAGGKRLAFVALVEKTRQSLFNILIEKNANSPNPIPHLDQQLKTKDKRPIYKLAEKKNLIPSAGKMIQYQLVRDYLIHPEDVPYQEFPDDDDVVNTFEGITKCLDKKTRKIAAIMVPNTATPDQIQQLTQMVALNASYKSGHPFTVTDTYIGKEQNFVDMAIADEQASIVDHSKRIVSKMTPDYDANGKRIRRNQKLDYLLGQQILDPAQRQELGDSITHRNHLDHGHSDDTDTQEMIDPTAQEKLRNNTVSLLKKYIDSRIKKTP